LYNSSVDGMCDYLHAVITVMLVMFFSACGGGFA